MICLCNTVPRSEIETAIRNGARTLDEIADATMAGVGACGGSCRVDLRQLLEHYLQTGTFPEGRLHLLRRRRGCR